MEQLLPRHVDLLNARITELGLEAFRSRILAEAWTAYELVGASQTATRKPGTTRFGGHPDLPEGFDTDELEGFEFVYQVDLADLPGGDQLGLPAEGMLSVFSHQDPYYGGKTLFSRPSKWVRHRMPEPQPDYIFSDVKPWKLKVAATVDLPSHGDDVHDAIQEAGLLEAYEELERTKFHQVQGPRFGEILGRQATLNGDMREDAAEECGGKPSEWRSLWKLFSSSDSGLVISDFHLLHGMIRRRHLRAGDFGQVYSVQSNG